MPNDTTNAPFFDLSLTYFLNHFIPFGDLLNRYGRWSE